MARAARLERLTVPGSWRSARLVARRPENATARTLLLEAPSWPGHLPGQHVDVRLTAEDGYQAVRSYSLAAPADGGRIELGIEPALGGEVSPYLADTLPVGADVEVTGPLGGWFVWHPERRGPVLLMAGGAGIVPVIAMVRARREAGSTAPFHLLYSVRDPDRVWYQDELAAPDASLRVDTLYSRNAPPHTPRLPGRVRASDLPPPPPPPTSPPSGTAPAAPSDAAPGTVPSSGPPSSFPSREGKEADLGTQCYVCGPTGFVEHVGNLLVTAGYPPELIRTERFG
uniref:FAD-binding oxidoreductase n=1 Tax=Streptomyces fructofermentans TaxID=152141 RepID=UPI003570E4D2